MKTLPVAAFVAGLAVVVPARAAEKLTIAAAANVRPALEEIGAAFERVSGVPLTISYGASGTLARQIEQGAPFDVFLSADTGFVDQLDRKVLLASGSRAAYAVGTLVIVTARGRPAVSSIDDLKRREFSRIAVANPETAPYGRAAMLALTTSGLASALKPNLVFAESVRDALRYVETGDADAGFAAESEARESGLRRFVVPRERYPPIRQEGAIVARSVHGREAAAFLGFLRSAPAREIWTRFGYLLP
jgi:molybdate transport system substrate-binding protein